MVHKLITLSLQWPSVWILVHLSMVRLTLVDQMAEPEICDLGELFCHPTPILVIL